MKILVIDNYDSFTYNLVQYLQELDCEVSVKRNDKLDLKQVIEFDKIVLSPGPGLPSQAGLLKEIIKTYAPTKPILGVCLGQQAIAEVFGGSLVNLKTVYHGVASQINLINFDAVLYKDLPNKLHVGRYHSWVVAKELPSVLIPTSIDADGEIMSLRHRDFDVRGVQFHPESVLTPDGKTIIKNWVTH